MRKKEAYGRMRNVEGDRWKKKKKKEEEEEEEDDTRRGRIEEGNVEE